MAATKQDKVYDILGFAPDADPATPGACSKMENMYPTERGWRAAPILKTDGLWPTANGSYATVNSMQDVSNAISGRSAPLFLIHGQNGKFILHGTNGAPYDLNTANTFFGLSTNIRAALFGKDLFVVAGGLTIATVAPTAGQLATIYAPDESANLTATDVVVADRFVVLLGTGDKWRCCARDNSRSWTLSPTTLAAKGRLPTGDTDSFVGGLALGNEVYGFMSRQTWRGRFIPGSAEVWEWEIAPFNHGALGSAYKFPGTKYKRGIIWLANEGLLYWDGAQLINLMEGKLLRWYATTTGNVGSQFFGANVVYDELRNCVWVQFPDTSYVQRTFIVQPETRRWAEYKRPIGTALCSAIASTLSGEFQGGVFGLNANTVWSMGAGNNGTKPSPMNTVAPSTQTANIVLNDFGGVYTDSELTGVEFKFVTPPSTAYAVGLTRNNLEDGLVTASPTIARADDGVFHLRQNARWHRVDAKMTGDFEVIGYALEAEQTGLR